MCQQSYLSACSLSYVALSHVASGPLCAHLLHERRSVTARPPCPLLNLRQVLFRYRLCAWRGCISFGLHRNRFSASNACSSGCAPIVACVGDCRSARCTLHFIDSCRRCGMISWHHLPFCTADNLGESNPLDGTDGPRKLYTRRADANLPPFMSSVLLIACSTH